MSEYYKEQHPLLCEEVSEEEHYSPRYHRRLRSSCYRSRSRNNLKGAAAIISRWPDHWSSFLAYWWIGLGMISLMTFIIYNSLFAFAFIQPTNPKPLGLSITNGNLKTSPELTSLPEVYMHVFVDQNEQIDLNQYIPYIEVISKKYDSFKYHLIVVANDTNADWLSSEENNQVALNTLWNKWPPKKTVTMSDILIEHISLSAYMDSSPLRKYWRFLPHQLIQFLVRAISIWDKGGIAFNPHILTPRSQHTLYTEKLQKLLNKYLNSKKVVNDFKIVNKINKTVKKERKLNNIRDIINALENDSSGNNLSQQSLAEAENIQPPVITRNERHLMAVDGMGKHTHEKNTELLNHIEIQPHTYSIENHIKESKYHDAINNTSTESARVLDIGHNTTKLSLLPQFLEFLFHNKINLKTNPTEATVTNRTRKSVIDSSEIVPNTNSLSAHPLEKVERKNVDIYKPVVISAVGLYNKSEHNNTIVETASNESSEFVEKNRLTLDLRGNIIATDIPCHAFLGTVFSNSIHHNKEESVTDFIIAELTIFCKGLLSSCVGIDLILL